MDAGRLTHIQEVQNGWEDLRGFHHGIKAFSGSQTFRVTDDQGNMNQFLIEPGFGFLDDTVFAKGGAVVRGKDDQ